MDCLFCKIIENKTSKYKIAENNFAIAILDVHPISDGHTLILPKKHIENIHMLNEQTGTKILELGKIIAKKLEENFDYSGISLMQNNGFCQDIPHFHLHVFGRTKKNDITISYPKGVNETKNHLTEVMKKMTKI